MERGQPIRFYWGSQLAQHLGIGDSTLRKWAIALEKTGYIFERDEHNNRAYMDSDLIALRELKECLATRMKIEDAAAIIANKYKKNESENARTEVATRTIPQYDIQIAELQALMQHTFDESLNELKNQMASLLAERDKKVYEVLEQWEREKNTIIERQQNQLQQLGQALQQIQETQLQLSAAQQTKKPWWKLF